MFQGKEVGKTESGNKYIILQDGPVSFHISIDINNIIYYDHVQNPSSREDIMKCIESLEKTST